MAYVLSRNRRKERTMPFSIEEFRDLLRILEQHPEWRAELRRWVLSEELLTLPQVDRELVEVQLQAEAHLEGVEARL
ncbi:MAG: hypothetical protein ACK4Z6_05090, partial [Candidatus Methylomirabilales bacterium]